jgi:hypothetical protein
MRAGQALNVAPNLDGAMRAAMSASSVLVTSAMEHDRAAISAAMQRDIDHDHSVPLDAVTRYQRNALIVTVREAKKLLKDIERLLDPYREDTRSVRPAKAGRIVMTVTAVSDRRDPGPPPASGNGARRR